MNYIDRTKLQSKLKIFSDIELEELHLCVLNKEIEERKEKQVELVLNGMYK